MKTRMLERAGPCQVGFIRLEKNPEREVNQTNVDCTGTGTDFRLNLHTQNRNNSLCNYVAQFEYTGFFFKTLIRKSDTVKIILKEFTFV